MSESQNYSDIIALVRALEDPDRFTEVIDKYFYEEEDVVDYEIFESSLRFIDILFVAIADYLDMDVNELGDFILMEKFKHDLFGDDD